MSIKHEMRLILVATQFLTRIPVQLKSYQPHWLHQSSRHFPAVGIMVGGLCAAVYWLASIAFTPLVAAVISTAFGVKMTGAFHEDGLADTCDGLGGGLTRERTLSIMKDSRIGTYGTLGLLCVIFIKISLLSSLPTMQGIVALIVAHCSSRLMCIGLIVVMPYGGEIDHAKAKPMAQQMTKLQWLVSSLWLAGVMVALLIIFPNTMLDIALEQWLLVIVLAVITLLYMYRLLLRRLQGYTGDGLGATQQLTELAVYAGLAANIMN